MQVFEALGICRKLLMPETGGKIQRFYFKIFLGVPYRSNIGLHQPELRCVSWMGILSRPILSSAL